MLMQQSARCAGILGRTLAALALAAGAALAAAATSSNAVFIPALVNSSTVPSTQEVNPYGVAFVPDGFPAYGLLGAGDVLVSNFNSSSNLQGTGTTIVQIKKSHVVAPGVAPVFFTSSLTGLSTALGVLRGGFVLVGNVPTTDGTFKTIGQGAVQVIDQNGHLVHTWTDAKLLDGPWYLTIDDHGSYAHVFVSSVLNGTVSRFDVEVGAYGLTVTGKTLVATGYTWVPNAAAVVLGPTGLAYDEATDTLYVASTADNAIYAVSQASTRWSPENRGEVVFSDPHLRGPLALRFAPNGDLLTSNGDAVKGSVAHPSEIVEFTKYGQFVREYNVDASQGAAFGFDTVLAPGAWFNYAAIDDATNSISIYHLP